MVAKTFKRSGTLDQLSEGQDVDDFAWGGIAGGACIFAVHGSTGARKDGRLPAGLRRFHAVFRMGAAAASVSEMSCPSMDFFNNEYTSGEP